ncbi:GntR family transcriptional regulator [Leucobacter albus]|uniref:GntR family transcriptional regulator n=1 Tax=Leucobacter albus TaxID=272210 RepID=A0ABW3TPH0_9MICO
MSAQLHGTDAFAELGSAAPRVGLRDHVYDRILKLLLGGTVEPGTRLGIDTLARQLGVSPTPVREAFVELERTGLVTREALKGYRMAPPLSPRQYGELLEARTMLETTAARLATPATPALLAQLREAHEAHRVSVDRILEYPGEVSDEVAVEAAADFYAKDTGFHRVIFEHCGNRYVSSMSDSLGAQLHRMRQVVHSGVPDAREALAEHEIILAAFAGTGSGITPEAAMAHHVEQVRRRALGLDAAPS